MFCFFFINSNKLLLLIYVVQNFYILHYNTVYSLREYIVVKRLNDVVQWDSIERMFDFQS